jgi:polysaccharide export outer membrane protein
MQVIRSIVPSNADQRAHALGVAGAAIGVLLCSVVAVRAEYRVHVGDVVEITVARIPDLQRRVPVQLDGTISYPLLGTLAAAGLSPSEMQAKIRAALATKVFRQRTSDGREMPVLVDPEDVTAVVVEYRPIYVNGDVFKPGEYPYRPFMTVRQAVALSGGYDPTHSRMTNPLLEAADLRGTYQALSIELAKENAVVWRIKAELGGNVTLDPASLTDGSVPKATISEIVNVETEQLKTRIADHQRERDYLQRSLKQGKEHAALLTRQEQTEEQGTKADNEELQKLVELFAKGAVASPRVTDARRAVLLSSSRMLQTSAQLMQVQKQQDEIARQLERLEDLYRMALLHDLQEENMKAGQIRARLESVAERLQIAGAMKSPLARGPAHQADIVIHRKADKGWAQLGADEEMELEPGDVVEVSLRPDYAIGAAPPFSSDEGASRLSAAR